MSLKKVKMPEQVPEVRNTNFQEVSLGYDEKMAIEEANRCLNCKTKPCVNGCPVSVKIPEFISLVQEGKFLEAYKIITQTNSLPAICGRVCPQETQCEGLCVRGVKGEPVAIGRLERFVSDYYLENFKSKNDPIKLSNSKKIAVIGAGPSGLTCAAELAKKGYPVTIFEAFHAPGGVLTYGIPEFRLPKQLVQNEINLIKDLGVDIKTNMVIGKILSIDELFEDDYKAVFISSGAGLPRFMNIPGENLNGIYSANEFLTRVNLMKAYKFPDWDTPVKIGKSVAVVGAGNVAMDAARVAKRLGATNVHIIYRRSEEEMPARLEEIHHAKEEGITFNLLTNPTAIIGTDDGWVKELECVKMELSSPDSSGRKRPVEKENSLHTIPVDTVIIAIGQSPNPMISSTTKDLKTTSWGGVVVDEKTLATSINGVYAGGDAVTGAATVILAMGAGRTAANSINEYLK